jgi:hypothetical protein
MIAHKFIVPNFETITKCHETPTTIQLLKVVLEFPPNQIIHDHKVYTPDTLLVLLVANNSKRSEHNNFDRSLAYIHIYNPLLVFYRISIASAHRLAFVRIPSAHEIVSRSEAGSYHQVPFQVGCDLVVRGKYHRFSPFLHE